MVKIKKILITVFIVITLLLTGCGKANDKEIRNKFIKEAENLKGYHLEGDLTLTNNDDTYNYNVDVSFSKDDLFKVKLVNKNNEYEQTILRNNDGVYVITPSLNKSFKFQSEWPYNNSQSYLLQSVAKDLKEDKDYKFVKKDKNYIFTTKVNYPNNPNYIKQNITLDKNYNLSKVKVMDANDIPYIIFKVTEIDKKAIYDKNQFSLELEKDKLIEDPKEEETNKEITPTTDVLNEALFPLYLPNNTALSNKEVIDTTNGKRVIMTFEGDNPFILVQENAIKEKELTVIPTYGEPYQLIDTVGSLTDISYTWASNGIEYYIVSDVMGQKELLEVAKSINSVATLNEK